MTVFRSDFLFRFNHCYTLCISFDVFSAGEPANYWLLATKNLTSKYPVLCFVFKSAEITSPLKLENKSSKISLFDWIKVNDLQVLPRGQINQPQSKLQFSIYCKDWRSHHMGERLLILRLPWGSSKFRSRIRTVYSPNLDR